LASPLKTHWTTKIGQAAGHPAAFLVVLVYALLWLIFDRTTFDWNAVATLAVFVMTLFIQRANRRDNLALHAKLRQ
jgi:low affinity Fe/Cu permease